MNLTRRSLFKGLAAALTARVLVDVAQIELPELVEVEPIAEPFDVSRLNGLFKEVYARSPESTLYTIPFDRADWSGFAYAAAKPED